MASCAPGSAAWISRAMATGVPGSSSPTMTRAEHEALDHGRVLEREGLADHAAHGEPDEVRLRDAETVEQSLEILRHLIERVGPGGRARLPVAARVEAQHGVPGSEGLGLVVPHVQVAGERMAQRDHRAATLFFVVDLDAVGLDLHDRSSLLFAGGGAGTDLVVGAIAADHVTGGGVEAPCADAAAFV